MTDYNDGNWHTPNGGDCPVDDTAEVEVVWLSVVDGLPDIAKSPAKNVQFMDPAMVAFRVVKRAPMELWININTWGLGGIYRDKDDADASASSDRIRTIHVREVIE